MLLFKPYHVEAVIIGRKTQTRRNWKKPRVKIGSRHFAKTVMLSPVWFARVEILDVWKEPLGAISPEDAWKEGGYTPAEFAQLFEAINGHYDPNQEITAVEFEAVEFPDWVEACIVSGCSVVDLLNNILKGGEVLV